MKRLKKEVLDGILRNRMEFDLRMRRVSGASLMVAQEGEVVTKLYMGVKDVKAEPLSPHTIYRLASMTKPITAVACLIGVQNGWFRLEDKVSDYLPAFANLMVGREEAGETIVPDHEPKSELQIYQMLCHGNGFMCEDRVTAIQEERIPDAAYTDLGTLVSYCAENTMLAFDPMSRSVYTGWISFDAIARILELKSGMPFADFLDRYIFAPLGIKDITYRPTPEQWSRLITMSDRACGPGFVSVDMGEHIFEAMPRSYHCAGAGLMGSMEDYFVFAEMLRRKGSYHGVQILRPEIVQLLHKPYVPDGTPGRDPYDSWGLGVRVAVHNPVLPEGTYGWSGAYGTHFWIDPENDITAVYMRNSRWYDSHGAGETGKNFEKDVMRALSES